MARGKRIGGRRIRATTTGDLLVAAAFVASAGVMAVTYGSQSNWIAHAMTGMVALALVLEIDVLGGVMTRRLKGPNVKNMFSVHKHASAQLVAFTSLTFSFGLWIRFQHGDPMLATTHGWLGAALVALAVIQWGSCHFKRRRSVKLCHMALGYLLPVFVAIQSILGFMLALA